MSEVCIYKIKNEWFISSKRWYKIYINIGVGKFCEYPALTDMYSIETLGM